MKKTLSVILSVILCAALAPSLMTGVYAKSGGIAGDINKDRTVDNKDVVTLFRYINGDTSVDIDTTACDTNGDGSQNNKDVVVLFRHVCDPVSVKIYYGIQGSDTAFEREWKQAYADYVMAQTEYYQSYSLIYLDDDSVPELLLIGEFESTGEVLCTYHNGTVVELPLTKLYNTLYIPDSGLLKHTDKRVGYMGDAIFQYATDEVYKLENGKFSLLISGGYEYVEEYGRNKYTIDDKDVSEATYKQRFNQVFDDSKAVPAEKNEMTYSQLMKELSTDDLVPEWEWKKAYADYVKTQSYDYRSYSLIYLDDNCIPELLLIGEIETSGEILCTYHNGTVVETYLFRLYNAEYIPNSGLLRNTAAHNGLVFDDVYKLENGRFDLLVSGGYQFVDFIDGQYVELEEDQYKYKIDDTAVSESTYKQRFNQVFDSSKAISAEKNEMTYSQLMRELSADDTVPDWEWKEAYAYYVLANKEEYQSYSLIYLDYDSIPELLLIGISESSGEIICTYHDGAVVEQMLDRLYGASYIPNSGLIRNKNGSFGLIVDEVYKLENGKFNLLVSGGYEYIDEYFNILEEDQYKYKIGGKEVSESTYKQKFNQVFDSSRAVSAETNIMTYWQLMEVLSVF